MTSTEYGTRKHSDKFFLFMVLYGGDVTEGRIEYNSQLSQIDIYYVIYSL